MGFTFLHTADWQLGKPFGRFDPEQGAVLRHARIEMIDRVAAEARAAGALHVLVAGDVFDSETPRPDLLRQVMAKLAAQAPIVWHLLPGNHDPARAGGVWEAVRALPPPANVTLQLTPMPATIADGVVLLPSPLTAKATTSDPTAWMSDAATPAGTLRIGMAHGSIKGFGSLGESNIPIDPRRATLAGLAYLALGDWHGTKRIGADTWYSGTPEPDSFSDNDPGHALVVRLAGATAPPDVTMIPTAAYHWLSRPMVLTRAGDLAPLAAEIATFGAAASRHLIEAPLDGNISLTDQRALGAEIARLTGQLFYFKADQRRLRIATDAGDLAWLGSGPLATVAERLQALSGDGREDGRVAARALRLLMAFRAESGGPAP